MSDETSKPTGLRWLYDTLIGERDPWAMILLAVVLLGGGLTGAVGGMEYLLPKPGAFALGIGLTCALFLLEGKYVGKYHPGRRQFFTLVLMVVFAFFMTVRYYHELARTRDAGETTNIAASHHGRLVRVIYAPRLAEAEELTNRAQEKYEASERERNAGTGTGRTGYGPRAQALQREGDEFRDKAAALTGPLARLKPYAEVDVAAMSAEDIFQAAQILYDSAPVEWRAGLSEPQREEYIDASRESPLLTPWIRLAASDPVDWIAWSALALALGIDLTGFGIGSMMVKKMPDERPVRQRMASGVATAKQTWNTMRQALADPAGHDDVQDPLRVLHLRLEGTTHAADFLDTLYEAIDPETGEIDYQALRNHPDPSYRRSARWLIDAFRNPGWLSNPADGMFVIPAEHYPAVTAWAQSYILKELDHRDSVLLADAKREKKAKPGTKDERSVLPVERRIKAVLPPPVKQDPAAEIRLMRHRVKTAAAEASAPAVAISAVPNTPVVLQASAVEAVRPTAAPVAAVVPTALAASTHAVTAAVQTPRPLVVEQRRATLVPDEDEVATIHDAPELVRERRTVSVPPVAVEPVTVELVADDPTPVGLNPRAVDRIREEVERVKREMERDLEEPTQPSMIMRAADLPVPAVEPPPHEHSDEPPTDLIRVPDEEEPTGEVPVPSRADPPTPLAPWVPDFSEENWADRPTGSTVVTGRPRERGESGLVLRDDALRHGRIVSLTYRTQPPRLMGADLTSPHAPRIRAVLRELAPAVAK